jgi:hypothetical protein
MGQQLRDVGAMWKPKPEAKSEGSGSVTIGGMKQWFVVVKNKHRIDGSNQPDFKLISSKEPEEDTYTPKAQGDGDPGSEDVPF